MSRFDTELGFYLEHQAEFFDQYPHKFLVFKGRELLGVYESMVDAVARTSETHPIGTFFVQECESPSISTIQTFHSRVSFA